MLVKRNRFVPRWQGAIHGHAVNVCRSFFPKLCVFHEFDDLLQESYLVFMKCSRTYGNKVDNDAWFMALFTRMLHNRMIGLLQHRATRYSFIEDDENATEVGRDDDTLQRLVIKELPAKVRMCLRLIADTGDKKALKTLQKLYPSSI